MSFCPIKKHTLEQHGELHIIRECVWRKNKKIFAETSPETQMPSILNNDNEESLISGILSGKLFGFAVLDVKTPLEQIKKYEKAGFLFPLVIRRQTITEEHLSSYMRERFIEERAKIERHTVIQTYNGSQVLVFTPIIQFWVSRGMEISNVTKFYQFFQA